MNMYVIMRQLEPIESTAKIILSENFPCTRFSLALSHTFPHDSNETTTTTTTTLAMMMAVSGNYKCKLYRVHMRTQQDGKTRGL